MSDEVKVHFLIAGSDTRPPCGMVGNSPPYATTVAANVTCYLCMQSRAFKKAAPHLANQDASSLVSVKWLRPQGAP